MKTLALCLVAFLVVISSGRADAQALVRKIFTTFSVILQSIDDDGRCHFQTLWADGKSVDFQVAGVVDRIGARDIEMRAFGAERLYLAGAHSHQYFIVNPRSGELLDRLIVGAGEISPDARFIAYDNFVGRGNPNDSTIYLLYDMALSPTQNRMGAAAAIGASGPLGGVSSGWAMYPRENRLSQTYDASQAASQSAHIAESPFFWLDSRTLSFVDYSNGVANVVVVKLGEAAHDIKVQELPLDPASVLDYSSLDAGVPPAKYLQVSWIGIVSVAGKTTLRLTFPGEDRRYSRWSLDIPF